MWLFRQYRWVFLDLEGKENLVVGWDIIELIKGKGYITLPVETEPNL